MLILVKTELKQHELFTSSIKEFDNNERISISTKLSFQVISIPLRKQDNSIFIYLSKVIITFAKSVNPNERHVCKFAKGQESRVM